MTSKYIVILLIAFVCVSFGLPKNIQKKVDKEIRETYKVEAFSLSVVTIDSEIASTLPSTFTNNNLLKITSNQSQLGYAYISKARSKTDEFDYLVLLDNDLIIQKTKVLVYREDYGSEIGSKRWLKQFIGKTQDDTLIYQDNIVAISGATISVKSMTTAINNLLKSLKILHSKQVL